MLNRVRFVLGVVVWGKVRSNTYQSPPISQSTAETKICIERRGRRILSLWWGRTLHQLCTCNYSWSENTLFSLLLLLPLPTICFSNYTELRSSIILLLHFVTIRCCCTLLLYALVDVFDSIRRFFFVIGLRRTLIFVLVLQNILLLLSVCFDNWKLISSLEKCDGSDGIRNEEPPTHTTI